ncbi:hypothetical protein BCR41DRAFT_98366 [Lobosporangium transversale]|uniref:Uncharacterized protein n=1 Tax=Lobosporangium transversale TaxID=64571 RepID=A0A1Y2GJP1_9FUNG|nr:hypothetical protein BCR41DRAFT_98366 [Lobosporangium transversale]ORZ12960.1 hypothetical protein BCR41DRAFT_98366 [Lobosporangium transversale]|eukprot:XP_021880309.1 hypothetical protein BCR41DRAFT_98366 [Lobosporangium transversale]
MYYPNAWDLPEDPRKTHPEMKPVPLVIEDTTNGEDTPVPSGKGKPVFPWETPTDSNAPKSPRMPTRRYYNYAATAEGQRRQKKLEEIKRLELEEAALEQIRHQEYARYEQNRRKEEAHEQMTGSQAFENFRLVNAWDIDRGVQLSILRQTEKRRPRSRKSSAGGIRKGYGLEDMLAYEARQRQEQYEAEIVRKRLEEEERWAKEQEEARIKEEELRLEKIRLAKLARMRALQRQKQQEESSYTFRNAWDPPNVSLVKKKLRIEDDEIDIALPLRQDRRTTRDISWFGGAGATNKEPTNITAIQRAGGRAAAAVAAAVGTAGIAIATENRSGIVHRSTESATDTAVTNTTEKNAQPGRTRAGQATKGSEGQLSTVTGSHTTVGGAERSSTQDNIVGRKSSTTATSTAALSSSSISSASSTVKMTTPGSYRFVRTTVITTITRRKFKDGVEVSSTSNTSTVGGEKMFEIPAGPRSGSYFGKEGRRAVTLSSTQGASRLTSDAQVTSAQQEQRTTTQSQTTTNKSSSAVTNASVTSSDSRSQRSDETESTEVSASLQKVGHKTTTMTSKAVSKMESETESSHFISTNTQVSGSMFEVEAGGFRRQQNGGSSLQIDTKSPILKRNEREEEAVEVQDRQKLLDLREKNASATAAAEAMEVLSRYPQATSRFGGARTISSTITSSSRHSTGGVLYANDPNLPRHSVLTSTSMTSKGKAPKALALHTATSSDSEEDVLYQGQDLDELEYFGERYTQTNLPLGSPYMPSTPLAPSFHRYGASASGYSSRAGSRPTTPGPGTPSRLGPGTPKLLSKKPFEFKLNPNNISAVMPSAQQTAPLDTGFSNYRIEWNWKELLGKKPRHWTAEAGEEYYDPYNALSTHGSQADSDEDRHILESSSESESDEDDIHSQHGKSGSEASSGKIGPRGSSPSFTMGGDNDFTRESGFVIRGGKIARRRSSMVLDRREL